MSGEPEVKNVVRLEKIKRALDRVHSRMTRYWVEGRHIDNDINDIYLMVYDMVYDLRLKCGGPDGGADA